MKTTERGIEKHMQCWTFAETSLLRALRRIKPDGGQVSSVKDLRMELQTSNQTS